MAENVDVPEGYRIAWAGKFQYYERAKARLEILVPLTILLIFFMLYLFLARVRPADPTPNVEDPSA